MRRPHARGGFHGWSARHPGSSAGARIAPDRGRRRARGGIPRRRSLDHPGGRPRGQDPPRGRILRARPARSHAGDRALRPRRAGGAAGNDPGAARASACGVSAMAREEPRLVHALRLPGGERVMLRPVCPRDAEALQNYVRALPPAEIERVTHLDVRNQLALLAQTRIDGGWSPIGEARYALAPDRLDCEFALSVADDFRGKGLGTLLLADLERRARSLGARYLVGDVLRSNEAMQALARKAGFAMAGVPRDAKLVRIVKDLALSRTALPRET